MLKADKFMPALFFWGLKMSFKNPENPRMKRAQSVIEYALLVAIAIIALIATTNFVSRLQRRVGAFEEHFRTASGLIGGADPTGGRER